MKGGPGWMVDRAYASKLEELLKRENYLEEIQKLNVSRKHQKKYHREGSDDEYEGDNEEAATKTTTEQASSTREEEEEWKPVTKQQQQEEEEEEEELEGFCPKYEKPFSPKSVLQFYKLFNRNPKEFRKMAENLGQVDDMSGSEDSSMISSGSDEDHMSSSGESEGARPYTPDIRRPKKKRPKAAHLRERK